MSTSVSSAHNQEELRSIQGQIHEKKTSILDSTRRMLGLINESEVVGTNTAAVSFIFSIRNFSLIDFFCRNWLNNEKNWKISKNAVMGLMRT